MFQNYALFDHRNVYQNIAAPLKAHHEDKQVIKEKSSTNHERLSNR